MSADLAGAYASSSTAPGDPSGTSNEFNDRTARTGARERSKGGRSFSYNRENRDPGGDGDSDNREAYIDEPYGENLAGSLKAMRTASDAYEACMAAFRTQVDKAAEQRVPPNVAIPGDSGARNLFLLLLTDSQQRDLFLEFASAQANWPRIKPLVGAPPYSFLNPSDASVLNASGFARGRINMTYDKVGSIANQHQFGPGQLEDDHTRQYRISSRDRNPYAPVPGIDYFGESMSGDLVLLVRVKRHTKANVHEMLRSSIRRKELMFPQVGDVLTLTESARLMSIRGMRSVAAARKARVKVKAVWPRSQGASTAAVLVGL
jgi:hypothetical protein